MEVTFEFDAELFEWDARDDASWVFVQLPLDVADEIRRHFAGRVYETIVPRNVRLAEAPSHGLPILQYDIRSRGAEAYLSLAREVARSAA